ncbi:GHMP family kinase ATP-binding protein [Desulfoluna spongiiphila]|uniref:GHMP family kinase ATP-binding protein n=1 Tax=Desulfoluna spongiiphila TaxID=419481 RepID=UPI00125A5549|nr:galactokinase [Desulfoluna spongiiphila]VVS95452.1 ribosomal protein s5 domain 2-type fold [Desulfoluna spongiiphila]
MPNETGRPTTTTVVTSAPCRVDMGGTLDLATFHLPLRHLDPVTFNLALDLRTRVRISPYTRGRVRIASRGFESAEFPARELPFDHPMGLMFGIAAFFDASGVAIDIDSASPPRSALGGSSVAAVALCAAFLVALEGMENGDALKWRAARIAQSVESAVAGVVCGIQDQVAAAFGGVSLWHWDGEGAHRRTPVLTPGTADLSSHFAVAYCGIPHDSLDINGRWVKGFLSGKHRDEWHRTIGLTHAFAGAMAEQDWREAAELMNRETRIRVSMTPDVLDEAGQALVAAAVDHGCGARFTGAGGGGCLWTVGEAADVLAVKTAWSSICSETPGAGVLPAGVAWDGVTIHKAGDERP